MAIDTNTSSSRPRSSQALWLYALAASTFFAASSAPTPLYRVYQDAWGFSSAMVTLVFASYAFSLLVALLTTGSLSDHIGRRPAIVGAIVLEVVAMLVFADANSVGVLIAARVLQGFATGAATSALGAAILDTSRTRGSLVNTLSPLFGMGVGALGSSMLVEYAPAPMRLVYLVLIALFVLQAVWVMALPETVSRLPGTLASLVPRVRVPVAARGALLRIAPVNVAVWALGGFYLSLGPSLARAVTGTNNATMGGWVVFALTTGGLVAVLLLRALSTLRLLLTGAIVLAVGLLITLAGVHAGSAGIFFAGTVIAGMGFGSAFQGALRSVLPLAQAHERAGLMAALYVLSYLAFSIPAILAGTMAHAVGLRLTTDVYGISLVVLAAMTVVASGLGRNAAMAREGS
ncbi:4-hydroxybenzoate transporter [Caballeronia sordidicola]|uniref:4-hydroxybenzoate transporter n=1 Tax=Caballeronia sordidicola TaxID=196367 RepID=A0A158HV95_CABSO|nr:MFS transporter [Caballeronia sordidicola]SAL48324.1 4-hydroxybenzoate transporter [Caballeronia sordidicola]